MVGTRSRKTRTTSTAAAAAEPEEKPVSKSKAAASAAKKTEPTQEDTPASDPVENRAASENSEGVTEEQVRRTDHQLSTCSL